MFQTKVIFAASQTPEQRKAHAANWRRRDARQRDLNNMLGFWRACGKPLCRRSQTCSHDMHACFGRLWPLVAEDEKEYLRGCIIAWRDGGNRSAEAIHSAGLAAREKYFDGMATSRTVAAPPAPAGETRAVPQVRIRRL